MELKLFFIIFLFILFTFVVIVTLLNIAKYLQRKREYRRNEDMDKLIKYNSKIIEKKNNN